MFRHSFAVTALVLASASPALAADGDRAAADALFREARQAIARGDYETACPKLQASLKLDAAAGTLLNLSVCDERRGDILGAIARLEGALAIMKPTDDRAALVRTRLAELKKRLPPPAPTPTPAPEPTPTAAPTPAPPPPEAPKAQAMPLRTISYVAIGAGAASIATGLVLGGLAYDKKKTALAHCDANRVCDQEGFAAASSFRSLSTASSVAVVGGAIVAALGVVLYVTGKPSSSTRTALGPSIGPNGGGVGAWGTF